MTNSYLEYVFKFCTFAAVRNDLTAPWVPGVLGHRQQGRAY